MRPFCLKKSGAGTASAIISAAAVLTAATSLCAAKLTVPKTEAVVSDGEYIETFSTRAADIDGFIAEQSARLHPFDRITYAGIGENGRFEMTVERAPEVTISADGEEITVRALNGEKVADLLAREHIVYDALDHVEPDPSSAIRGNCTVTVARSFPVSISVDGGTKTTAAAGITVGELLVREGISLGGYDELNCSTNDMIYEGMNVEITRVEYKERERSHAIPYETEYVSSPHMKIGDSKVITEGEEGSASITITDKYVEGELVSSEVTETDVVDAVNEVIMQGEAFNVPYSTREGSYTLKDGIPTEYEYMLNGKVTAYYAPAGSGTYSGRPLVIGSVGVDPDVIPFGSELYIVSEDGSHVYGYAVASDTGYIKGSGVLCDAYMGTRYEDCLWWQAQYCNVYVLSVGDNSVSWR
ncbi:MAG: DUF348 domain-containing protein [Ruminiclostridium sp.]|nr:DUF348 domain-containing protein [Ruminiclostridium sp.]